MSSVAEMVAGLLAVMNEDELQEVVQEAKKIGKEIVLVTRPHEAGTAKAGSGMGALSWLQFSARWYAKTAEAVVEGRLPEGSFVNKMHPPTEGSLVLFGLKKAAFVTSYYYLVRVEDGAPGFVIELPDKSGDVRVSDATLVWEGSSLKDLNDTLRSLGVPESAS